MKSTSLSLLGALALAGAAYGQQPPDVVDHRLTPVGGDLVDAVEHDQHRGMVGGQGREVAVVDGGVAAHQPG